MIINSLDIQSITIPFMQIQYEDEQMQSLMSDDRVSYQPKSFPVPPQQPTETPTETPSTDLPKQIIHKVVYGDTLQGLSLQYSVPISKIKHRNHIDSDYIYHLKEIIIPNPETIPISKEKTEEMLIEEFVSHMNYSEKDRKVAKYYLLQTEWDMEAALKEYREDLEWEKKNKELIKTENLVPGRSQLKEIKRFYEMQELNIKKYN